MSRTIARIAGMAIAILLTSPAIAAEPWYSVRARAELGNQPRLSFPSGPLEFLGLAQTQVMGRLPFVELRVGQAIAPNVDTELSGAVRQDIQQPLANPELYHAYRSRVQWRQAGGVGLNPLYVPQIEDAIVTLRDPVRNGSLQVGQFLVPFGHDDYSAAAPPVAIAPAETPMTEYLTSLGPGAYQNSTFTRWRDVGAILTSQAGAFPYAVGVFNGSGPNRLDDNGDKDWFARLDWKSSETDLIGASVLWGKDQVFPNGFSDPGITVGRRRYGIHWRFNARDVVFRGEWAREQREGLDPAFRDGYVAEASQLMGSDLFYTVYSQYFDPNARPGVGYLIRETAIGDVRPLLPGLSLRVEVLYRWEFSGDQRDEYLRYLTSIEASLGGPRQEARHP